MGLHPSGYKSSNPFLESHNLVALALFVTASECDTTATPAPGSSLDPPRRAPLLKLSKERGIMAVYPGGFLITGRHFLSLHQIL